jgi:hypothetical protein
MNAQRLLSSTRGPRLSEDAFEGIIDSFEKGLHCVLEQRTELWPNVVEASAEAPDIMAIFPLEEACNLAVCFLSIWSFLTNSLVGCLQALIVVLPGLRSSANLASCRS